MTVLGQLTNDSTYNDVAQAIILEAFRRGYTLEEVIAVVSALIQESGLSPTIWGPAGQKITYGIAQQDGSYKNRFDPNAQVSEFFNRLDAKRKSAGHGDIWANIFWLQQGPNWPSAQYGLDNGRKAYLTEIKSHVDEATRLVNLYKDGGTPVSDNRPDFNEFPIWSPNCSDRGGTKIDAFFLHTQEGGGGDAAAENLANYLADPANQVSYHYTISQASDGGVTVVDCVDTDQMSWSVLSANGRSINLCFAGSKASWTRDEWLKQAKAIDVAAYLVVQDCKKYGIPTKVVPPPYTDRIPGISDHAYVTKVLGDGTHTDVGSNFPWDVFTAAVNKYASGKTDTPVTPPPAQRVFPKDYSDRELLEWIVAQLGVGDPTWPSKGMTLRDKVWSLGGPNA